MVTVFHSRPYLYRQKPTQIQKLFNNQAKPLPCFAFRLFALFFLNAPLCKDLRGFSGRFSLPCRAKRGHG